MRDLRAPTGTRRARHALAVVAVALFGLLSMHGWGSHTGAHAMAATTPSATVVATGSDPASHGHSEPAASEPDATAHVVASQPAGTGLDEPGDSGAGLLGLCLAVLAGLVLAIALLLTRRGVRIPRTLLPAWRSAVFIGRDRDPPRLGMLCVIRC